MRLYEIAELLDGELHGPNDLEIQGVSKIDEAGTGDISFISNPKYRKFLSQTKASAVILNKNSEPTDLPHIFVDDAYVGFVLLLKAFSPKAHDYIRGISERADVHHSTQVGENVHIGPFTYIGPDVTIGKNTIIYPGSVILKKVSIGEKCLIYPNVSIREECEIGNRVIIQNGAVVGSDGFGFAPKGKEYIKIPQLGKVIVEDDVEVGANVTIDRATLGATIIKKGTKLDNLVQIAHNVVVGENSVVAAQSGIAGSSKIGQHAVIGGQVGVSGHITLGDNVTVAAQSGISKSVEDGMVLFGTPALPLTRQKRIDVSLRHLPELVKKINRLEKELEGLKERDGEDNT
ncbi:MAG: UDP-3-O-(3-hydroxymyristoyl)glucosamine N-acyltransferase [Caldithrix sp.]|nr:UDP-3-O-(3-hydroxymyristoyl)glucosamine N-acyltransferase [Caldithrix sp.]